MSAKTMSNKNKNLRAAGLLVPALAAGLLTAAPADALVGQVAADGAYAFTAKVNVGEEQGCSGVLVDPQWVLSAASCFAKGGQPPVAGKPAVKTTVTVGRTDLAGTGGAVVEAVELVPRTDRDLVMVKLAQRVQGVAPVKVATAPAVAGEQLTAAGYGRTKTEWVPDRLHTGTFTVASVTGGDVALNGSDTAVICQGDAGGPALRATAGGSVELVAVNSRSWQGGCLDAPAGETRTGAVNARVDDLAAWIKTTAFRVQDDFTRDGVADLSAIWGDGSAHIYPGDKAKGLSGSSVAQIGGTTWKTLRQLAKGDFTNDGKADLMGIWEDGSLHLYKGDGAGKVTNQVPVTEGAKTWLTVKQTAAGDFTGDGIADLMAIWGDGTLHVYRGKGDGQLAPHVKVATGAATWGATKHFTAGDFNRDGIADLMTVWNDGTMHFYRGLGNGQIAAEVDVTQGGSTWLTIKQLAAGDFNADGTSDVMAVWNDGTMHLYKGNGTGGLTNGVTVAAGGATWTTVLHLA